MLIRYSFLSTLALFVACRAEFDVSRTELGPFRIAAIGVEDQGGECPVATAAIWSGEGPFHRQAVQMNWRLEGEELGEGWAVAVCESGLLELLAIDPEGIERTARVDVALRPNGVRVQREALVLPDLGLEARRELTGEPVRATAPEGEAMRVHLDGVTDTDSVSWMSPADQAHLLGLQRGSVDLLMETWSLDEEGVLVGREASSGTSSHLALVRDGVGGNAFLWVDAVFGAPDADFVRHEGRLIHAPGFETASFLSAQVEVDAQGWHLNALEEAVEDGANNAVCANGAPTFSLDWIANGRCPLDTLAGSTILLEIW